MMLTDSSLAHDSLGGADARAGAVARRCRRARQPRCSQGGGREAIRAVGASVLCLRPYSPELDPIEQLFAKLKGLIRSAAARTTDTLRMPSARLSTPSRKETLRDAIGTALDAISRSRGPHRPR